MDKFIITRDEETIKRLRALGFQEIPTNSGMVTFINNPVLFSKVDKEMKFVSTNVMCI